MADFVSTYCPFCDQRMTFKRPPFPWVGGLLLTVFTGGLGVVCLPFMVKPFRCYRCGSTLQEAQAAAQAVRSHQTGNGNQSEVGALPGFTRSDLVDPPPSKNFWTNLSSGQQIAVVLVGLMLFGWFLMATGHG